MQSLDKDLPTYAPKTVEQYLNSTIAVPRFNTFLLAIFAGLAMVLTAVGLYGVISYTVAQRTHEIGIRMALGAQPDDMLRLVISQGMRLALFGVGLGLVAALALTRFLSSLLFGVSSSTGFLRFRGRHAFRRGVPCLLHRRGEPCGGSDDCAAVRVNLPMSFEEFIGIGSSCWLSLAVFAAR